jgi:hypothetical protein
MGRIYTKVSGSNGFITIHRKIMDTSFYWDSYAVHMAVHLLLSANHEDREVSFNGQSVMVPRGSLITGRYTLAEDTGMPPSTVRNKLELLRKVGFLDIKPNNRFSLISICKYSDYQDKKKQFGHLTGQHEDNTRTTRGHKQQCNNVTMKQKDIYGEFVKLTKDEYAKLVAEIGQMNVDRQVDALNNYIGSKGDKYKSHYHTIIGWWHRDHPVESVKRRVL